MIAKTAKLNQRRHISRLVSKGVGKVKAQIILKAQILHRNIFNPVNFIGMAAVDAPNEGHISLCHSLLEN